MTKRLLLDGYRPMRRGEPARASAMVQIVQNPDGTGAMIEGASPSGPPPGTKLPQTTSYVHVPKK